MRRSVEMGAEAHAFLSQFAQLAQAENLESAGVGKNRPIPRHEPVQPAQLAHLLNSGTKIEVMCSRG